MALDVSDNDLQLKRLLGFFFDESQLNGYRLGRFKNHGESGLVCL